MSVHVSSQGKGKDSSDKKGTAPSHSAGVAATKPPDNTLGNLAVQDGAFPANIGSRNGFSIGPIQTKLQISSPGDRYEREADAVAARVAGTSASTSASTGFLSISGVGGNTAVQRLCSACEEEEGHVQRKTDGKPKSKPSANLQRALSNSDSGAPLSSPVRSSIEAHVGADLSSVRVHSNRTAQQAASSIGAKAFTHREHIYLGNNQSRSDLALMAHEATHVLQQRGGVSAQGWIQRVCDPATQSCLDAPEPEEYGECSPFDPVEVEHGADYNPCDVNVTTLTNYDLLGEYASALAVVSQGRGATGYFDYRNLQRRLILERDRRVGMGHAWLATMPPALPESLFRIVDGTGGSFQVVTVSGTVAMGTAENVNSAPLMTETQFNRFLTTRNIERIDENTYRMRMQVQAPATQDAYQPWGYNPSDPLGLNIFGASPYSIYSGGGGSGAYGNTGSDFPYLYTNPLSAGGISPSPTVIPIAPFESVPLPEVFASPEWFQRSPGYTRTDTLSHPPAMDPARAGQLRALIDAYRRAPGVPARIDPGVVANLEGDFVARGLTAPARAPGNNSVRGGTVAVAQTDIPNLIRNFPGASAGALPANLQGTPGTTGGTILEAANPTAVNHAEHVALESIRASIDEGLARGEISRASLRGRTVFLMVEQEPCSSCAAGSASSEGRIGIIEQFARRYPELTLEVRNMRTSRAYIYRGGVLLNPSGATAPVIAPELPELVAEAPGRGRAPMSGGRAVGFGAGAGGLIAIATSGGIMMFDSADHPDWGQELALAGGLGSGAGGLGTATELGIVRMGEQAMARSAMQGSAGRLTPGLTTGLGRFGGGAVGAVFVESISMGLLEEREHSGAEVVTRTARSAGLGGASVWAGATVGAAAGSAVPVAGTLVGFLVGLAVGGALYYVGDKLIPGGREDWDAIEAGCTPLPSVERWRSAGSTTRRPFSSAPFMCFLASTKVTMADGSSKRIESIAVGDKVLSYNEYTEVLEARRVEKVHALPPAEYLLMTFTNGKTLRVTQAHKLLGPRGWKSAIEYEIGEELYADLAVSSERTDLLKKSEQGKSKGLAKVQLQSMEIKPANEGVYDLNIDTTHTYFAESILAHNKLP